MVSRPSKGPGDRYIGGYSTYNKHQLGALYHTMGQSSCPAWCFAGIALFILTNGSGPTRNSFHLHTSCAEFLALGIVK